MKINNQTALRVTCGATALVIASMGFAAQANAAEEDEAEAASTSQPGRGDIIVTAQRRAEDVQRIPIAISVVDGDDMLKKNVTGSEEVLRDLPGVEIRKAPPGASIYIRGIATQQGGGELDPGVSFSVDGVYNPFIEASFMSFYDIQRIEVLKGPQGTLYGRNAIAGAINVITRSPVLGEFSGYGQASIGDYDYTGFTGAINVPLGDNAAFRFAGDYQDNEGYLDLGSDDLHSYAGRAKLKWVPDDVFSIEVRGEYGDYKGKGNSPVYYPFKPDAWTQFPTAPNVPQQSVWQGGGSVEINADLGFATLTYIPAYKRKKFRSATSGGSGVFIRSYVLDKQHTQELRLASNESMPLSWILGGYYYHGVNETGLNFFTTIDQHVVTTSVAAFGQATYSVSDALRFTGGLRFTQDKKVEDGINTLGGVLVSQISGIKWKWNNWTWRAGAEFDVTPDSMLYGSVSTGFKAGGTSLVAGPAAVFDPEKLTAYEIGLKNRLFDNTLILNLNAFYYDYTNYQASFTAPNPAFGGANVRRIANAGDAKIKGIEIEANWTPTDFDVFRATVAYLNGKFGDYIVPTANPAVFNDYSGSEMSLVPWAINASYSHDFPIGDSAHLVPQISARYNSDAWRDARQYANAGTWGPAGTYANPVGIQDQFVKLDANVSFSWGDDRYRISAYVKNITDKVVATSISATSAWLEPPRTFGASFYVGW